MVRRISLSHVFLAVAGLAVLHHAVAKISDDRKEELFAEVKNCVTSTNLTTEEFESMVANKKLPSSMEGKCFIKCVMEKMEYISDGSLNVVGIQATLEEQIEDQGKLTKAKEVVQECNDSVTTSGSCEYAAAISECFYRKGKAVGLDSIFMM